MSDNRNTHDGKSKNPQQSKGRTISFSQAKSRSTVYTPSKNGNRSRPSQEGARRPRQSSQKVGNNDRPSTRALVISAVIEIAFIIALWFRFSDLPVVIEKAAFGCILLWVTHTDLISRTIPNAAIIIAATIRILYLTYMLTTGIENMIMVWNSLIGCVVIGIFAFAASIFSERYSGRTGLGGGDIKLLAIAGLFFGLEGGILILFLACVAALASYTVDRNEDGTFPFAPSIAVSSAIIALI